ncbi:transposase is4 [Holotrichia oblita]|uniref:Transposase is4 n=1 Tax=Holotrichia oblita TaxID=644536 RepID=A0ACB9SGL4_HOLOL|nr:transposase is4 [Holotrichia oblita]
MATNYDSAQPINKIKRWSFIKKQRIDVPQPKAFREYNIGMGGVDLHDQFVNAYKIGIRGKKWLWPLLTQMINMATVNAWGLHKLVSEQPVDLLTYERTVTRHYLRCTEKSTFTTTLPKPNVPRSIAHDRIGHYPQRIASPLRCRQCHQRIRWICQKCNIALCVERSYFKGFHEK